jgi:S-disulfanyl-L-cysteine oxidoreductase SoxD
MLGRKPLPKISWLTSTWTLVASVSLLTLLTGRPANAQAGEAKIWNGVYSAAQADRGKANFEAACARCHHVELSGTDRAPALKGDNFWSHWENETVNTLFTKVRDQMPPNFGTVLEPEAKLDIVAYLLLTNGLPQGTDELKMNADVLDGIDIVKKGAGTRAANFALVQVVGCLSQGADRAWMLTKSSEPVVTRDQTPTPASPTQDRPIVLGAQTYLLLSVIPFKPDSQNGHKVEARGLLYRAPNDNRLDLTSLQTVDRSCAN